MKNTYQNLVKLNSATLKSARVYKTVVDLAVLLDHPTFGYPTGPKVDSYVLSGVANIREGLYHTLCSLFTKALLPLPSLEPEFYESALSDAVRDEDRAETNRITEHVRLQIGNQRGTAEDALCRSICDVIKAFPDCAGSWGGITNRKFVAKLNQLLIVSGHKPVRPDYSSWKNECASKMPAPSKTVRIMVVDDDVQELVKTLKALCGWKKVTLVPYKFNRGQTYPPSTNVMETIAKSILNGKPDIILMDQGLDNDLKGSDLVTVIRGLAPTVRFVANTGGSENELCAAGTYSNCNKGEKLWPVGEAIRSIESVNVK